MVGNGAVAVRRNTALCTGAASKYIDIATERRKSGRRGGILV